MADSVMSNDVTSTGDVSGSVTAEDTKEVGLIATMPRSGTWYNHIFFNCYNQLLQGNTDMYMSGSGTPPPLIDIDMGIKRLWICHAICPGFFRYQGQYRRDWDKLEFYNQGFNWAEGIVNQKIDYFDPALNDQVKIVYCARNPLDQAVSFFRHIQKHTDPTPRYRTDSDGKKHLIKDVREYLFSVGLESYIKQYLTYKVMKQIYPRNIMFVKYENLTRNPEQTFSSVLSFFGHDMSNPSHQEKMALALIHSSRDSVRKMEKAMGHSIGADQTDPNESHVRDGVIGKWKKHLNNEDIKIVQQRLGCFGISLDEFDIE